MRTPQAAEQRLENVLGRGRRYGSDKRRDDDAGHECAFDAAAQAGLATDQQSGGLPESRADDSPCAPFINIFGFGRKYDLSVPGVRRDARWDWWLRRWRHSGGYFVGVVRDIVVNVTDHRPRGQ